MESTHLYHYSAKVTDVYDGDTITVDIDLGLKTHIVGEKLRLSRINACELRGEEREEGLGARDYLRSRVMGKEVVIQTIKDKRGKYGRYIAEIWLANDVLGWTNINDEMVDKGFAIYQEY